MRSVIVAAMLAASPAAAQQVVRTEADLPSTRFPMAEPPSLFFLSDRFLSDTVPALRQAGEQVMAGSRFENAAIRNRIAHGLAAIAILQNRPADAERLILAERALQDKPQLRAIGMMTNEAIAASLAAPEGQRCHAMAARLDQRLRGAGPLARDEVLIRFGQAQTASHGYYAGTLVGFADPQARAQGSVDIMNGMLMAMYRVGATMLPPCRDAYAASMRRWLDDPANQPRDIWAERQPSPALFANAAPVVAAVWDTGIDADVFAGRMAIDPGEPLDGRDNDGNGVVDDVHGPTFDLKMRPQPSGLLPMSARLAQWYPFASAMTAGQSHLNFGLDTPEARAFAQRAREASAQDQGEDVYAADEIGFRGHGTFVAAQIAQAGPFARLYNVRALPFGSPPWSEPAAEPELARWVAAVPGIVQRLRGAGVRVVNMSWGMTIDGFAQGLIDYGQERDPARARTRARAMYDQARAALTSALSAAPEILFVAAAGNDNQTDETLGAIPQATGAPNLIVVGATGINGVPTSFTTFGSGVAIFARGEGVEALEPGGALGRRSGTSMAAPEVARAAAQMLAVNPRLTPVQLIEGLRATSTPGEGNMRLLHAANAVAWAQARR